MMNISVLAIFAVITAVAIVNAGIMTRVISRGLKLDAEGFKRFESAMLFMSLGFLSLAVGHSIKLISPYLMIGIGAQGLGTMLFVIGAIQLNKIPAEKKTGALAVEWGALEKEIEATRRARMIKPSIGLWKYISKKNLVLVEVTDMGVTPVFDSISQEIPSEKNIFPIIGVITPYDLKRMWGELGNKGGFWMTASDVKDEWVNQKFVVGKPSESFQLTNYIKTVTQKYGENVVCIGDFLDEMHSSLNDAQRQQLLSRMKILLQQSGSLLILIVDKGVHNVKELDLMERYADGKLEMHPGKTILHDFQTNEKRELSA